MGFSDSSPASVFHSAPPSDACPGAGAVHSSAADDRASRPPAPGRRGGPRTPEGKARSSQNAIKSGVFAKISVLPNEDPEEAACFHEGVIQALAPVGTVEITYAGQIANALWRLQRLAQEEAGVRESHARRYREALQAHHAVLCRPARLRKEWELHERFLGSAADTDLLSCDEAQQIVLRAQRVLYGVDMDDRWWQEFWGQFLRKTEWNFGLLRKAYLRFIADTVDWAIGPLGAQMYENLREELKEADVAAWRVREELREQFGDGGAFLSDREVNRLSKYGGAIGRDLKRAHEFLRLCQQERRKRERTALQESERTGVPPCGPEAASEAAPPALPEVNSDPNPEGDAGAGDEASFHAPPPDEHGAEAEPGTAPSSPSSSGEDRGPDLAEEEFLPEDAVYDRPLSRAVLGAGAGRRRGAEAADPTPRPIHWTPQLVKADQEARAMLQAMAEREEAERAAKNPMPPPPGGNSGTIRPETTAAEATAAGGPQEPASHSRSANSRLLHQNEPPAPAQPERQDPPGSQGEPTREPRASGRSPRPRRVSSSQNPPPSPDGAAHSAETAKQRETVKRSGRASRSNPPSKNEPASKNEPGTKNEPAIKNEPEDSTEGNGAATGAALRLRGRPPPEAPDLTWARSEADPPWPHPYTRMERAAFRRRFMASFMRMPPPWRAPSERSRCTKIRGVSSETAEPG